MSKEDHGFTITVNMSEFNKAFREAENDLNKIIRMWRKAERKRMYELAYKYKHILEIVKLSKIYGVIEVQTGEHIEKMCILRGVGILVTPQEREALIDWIKVLNGYSPLADDKLIERKNYDDQIDAQKIALEAIQERRIRDYNLCFFNPISQKLEPQKNRTWRRC